MEEWAWDRAVEQAQCGESAGEVQVLTLDGVVKCAQGKLPKSKVFAPFTQLKSLSIANVGLSSLADFPALPLLERLILSDNRIAGGLEHLVYAGLTSLRELDLSNNKIQAVEDLEPLAHLKLESLDLYECTVTRSVDYRTKVFGMMRSLRFLDKTDVAGNERPESDEESEDEDVDDVNGDGFEVEGEEGFEGDSKGVALHDEEDEGEDDGGRDEDGEYNDELEDEEEDDGGSYQEEVLAVSGRGVIQGYANNDQDSDEEVDDEGDDNVEVQEMEESGEEEVGEDDDEDVAVEEEEDDEEEPVSGTHVSTDGELDVQENEEDDVDENGELGHDEEDDDVEDNDALQEEVEDEEEVEEYGTKFVVQRISQPEEDEALEHRDDEEAQDLDGEDEDPVKEPVGLKPVRKRTREVTGEEERPAKH